jgi:hypothetical protein
MSARLRFEAWMGSSAGFVIPSRANAAPPPKAEMCLLEGREYTKMLLENSSLKEIPGQIEPLRRCVQFCNTRRKNNETQCREPFFQLRFGEREVILNPSRDRQCILQNHKGDT